MTCSTFALYTSSFTKDVNKALVAAETPEGDGGAKKRSDILARFETNFNHWLGVRIFFVFDCETLKPLLFRSMLVAYSFTLQARMYPYSPSSFASIVLGLHSHINAAQCGINVNQLLLFLTYLIPRFLLVSLCCCKICSILKLLTVTFMLLLIPNYQMISRLSIDGTATSRQFATTYSSVASLPHYPQISMVPLVLHCTLLPPTGPHTRFQSS